MPALEIMPQCPTMEEAQQRVNMYMGLSAMMMDRTTRPQQPRPEEELDGGLGEDSPISPKTSSKIARFVKRNLRGLRRRSHPQYHNSDPEIKEERPLVPAPGGGYHQKNQLELEPTFASIGVKYWPKIMEDEEEEPPEALLDG